MQFLRVTGGAKWIYASQDEYDCKSKRDWQVENEALEALEKVVSDRLMIMGKRYVGHVDPRPKPALAFYRIRHGSKYFG